MTRPRILNVDDNEIGRFTVTQMLRSAGFDVDEAATGQEALAKAETLPDIVLLDVRMPDIDGFEVCRRIKANPRTAGVTVVHLSATQIEPHDITAGLNWGADGYLTEPIGQAELVATVRAFLRLRRAEAAQRFLAEASRSLSNALQADDVLSRLASLAVPFFGELCLVDKLDAHGQLLGVAAVRARRNVPEPIALRRSPGGRGAHALARALSGAEAQLCAFADDAASVATALGIDERELPAALAELMPCSYVCVPMIARARRVGVLTLVSRAPDRRFSAVDVTLIEDLASRSALFVDNARLYEQAQEAITLRDNLLAVVSHDLKDPLNSVLMSCEVMHESTSDEVMRRRLDIMRRSARRMDRLIHDLLDLASLERAAIKLDLRPTPVAALVDEVLEQAAAQASEKDIEIVRDLPAGLAEVDCDRERVHQVLANLLSNALKFTPRGGRVSVSVSQSGEQTLVGVQDTGPGLSREQMSHVFDRFWQAQRTTARTGSGLGLSIAKAIIDAHGGSLTVHSEPGQGCRFEFRLQTSVPHSPVASALQAKD